MVIIYLCDDVLALVCFFCCKQKTAYELRISDWSSDVCSSDLQQRVGAQAALVLGAVEIDQALVERNLVISVEALQRLRDRLVDILHGLQHALAQVTGLVAIAQFDRLLRTGGRDRKSTRLNSSH